MDMILNRQGEAGSSWTHLTCVHAAERVPRVLLHPGRNRIARKINIFNVGCALRTDRQPNEDDGAWDAPYELCLLKYSATEITENTEIGKK